MKKVDPKQFKIERIESGVRNLDEILYGGLPKGSVTVFAGTPGAGKTILSQQICFHNATPNSKALFFQTLSEPTAKTLLYLSSFSFFKHEMLEECVKFVDLGGIMRKKGLEEASSLISEQIKKIRPSIVVIDSFKVFDDLAQTREELRKFSYEIAIKLMAWECTGFLLGEFSQRDIEVNPLFSIVDGIVMMKVKESSGEQRRTMQVVKMRGTNHNRDEHPIEIAENGIDVYAPRVTIRRDPSADKIQRNDKRCATGVDKLDQLLDGGIPYGSSVLISGIAGTGKTILSMEAIYRGAKQFNEKGIFISFEETEERLIAAAAGLGWNLEKEIKRGMIEIIFIPQPDIMVEQHLLLIHDRITNMKAKRVAIDSVSVFLHKVKDSQIAREKIFQLATLVQMANAVGFFVTDIPFGSKKISRFGVEETVVDGIILVTAAEENMDRQRYIEVFKLRNTDHQRGRHKMEIKKGGISIVTNRGK